MNQLLDLFVVFLMSLEYVVAYGCIFSKKNKRMWVIPVLVAGISAFLLYGVKLSVGDVRIFSHLCSMALLLFLISGEWKNRIGSVLEIFLLLCCIEQAGHTLLRVQNGRFILIEEISNSIYCIVSIFTVSILFLIGLMKTAKKGIGQKIWAVVTDKLHYLVAGMAVVMFFTIAGLEYAAPYVQKAGFPQFVLYMSALAYMSVGVLGGFVIYMRRLKYKMEDMLHREKLLNHMQGYYYETLLKQEEETRRYRHDMSNHLICLEGYIENKDNERAIAYLDKMQEQVTKIHRKNYLIGNRTIEIITNYYLGLLDDCTDTKVYGRLMENISIDNMTLCTIYSNLLQNAVEELSKRGENKFLRVNFNQDSEVTRISIQNSLSEESKGKKELFNSQKADKKNHGLGMRNVCEAVESCDGSIHFSREDSVVSVVVVLPN